MKDLLKKFGFDKAILFTSSSILLGALGGIFILFFITRYLSSYEQGYYFTFTSIASIQIFFELGFNKIITQYVAHEYAHLEINENKINGDINIASRLVSMFKMMIKWYSVISLLYFLTVLIFGFLFFSNYKNNSVNWLGPWILLSVANALNLLFSPIVSFLQGINQVKQISKILLFQQLGKLILIFTSFFLGGKLYSIGIGLFFSFLITILLIFRKYLYLLAYLWNYRIINKINYFDEIFPYQWRIAVSWICGFFIFNLFNPIIFKTNGPIIAGQTGMTLTALTGIQSLANAWISTKVPLFSSLISQKKFTESNSILKKTILESTNVIILFVTIFMLFLLFVNNYQIKFNDNDLKTRFLSPSLSLILSLTFILNHIVSCLATYIRCHKKDPYLLNSIISSLMVLISIFVFGNKYGLNGVIFSYFSIVIIIFPWSLYIYWVSKKKLEKSF